MKKNFPAYLLVSVVLLALTASCLQPLSFPGRFGYQVEVTNDMLTLFDIEAAYDSPAEGHVTVPIKTNTWSCDYFLSKGFTASMEVHLKAKNGAKNGSLIKNDSYDMGLSYSIYSTEATPGKFGTRAAEQGFDTFEFKVPVGNANPDGITLEMPPLKYDKHFAFCFTVDDSYITGWSRVFAGINARWIYNNDFTHMSSERGDGYKPEEPLCVTDGCGNDRRFTFGEAIWATNGNSYNPDGFIKDKNSSTYSPYISWEELQEMTDLGNAVYWHDIDTSKWKPGIVDDIVKGMQADYDRTYSKIGYFMRTMAQPNGDPNYLEAAQKSPLASVIRGTGKCQEVHIRRCGSLYKMNIFGGDPNGNYDDKLEELAAQAASDDPLLISMLIHRTDEKLTLPFFNDIYALYGKKGADNIWVTSYDELYEYMERKQTVTWTSRIEGDFKVFTVKVPKEQTFRYNELTFIVKGCSQPAVRVSDNLCGFSSASRADGTAIVNCNFSETLIPLVEKYVFLYERNHTEEYKLNAEYLVSLLREDLRDRYTSRINTVHDPTMEEYPLNGTYTDWEMKYYIMLYDGYVGSAELEL